MHSQDSLVLGLKEPLYAMDSTVIDLCLSLFPWADFRSTKAAIYKRRWQIELFFKWLKQNLCIKNFFGNSRNRLSN